MADKKKTANSAKSTIEHSIRVGSIKATVGVRQTNTGLEYRDFTLTRIWSSQATGKEQTSGSFFVQNEADLIQAVREISEYLRLADKPDAGAETVAPVTNVKAIGGATDNDTIE